MFQFFTVFGFISNYLLMKDVSPNLWVIQDKKYIFLNGSKMYTKNNFGRSNPISILSSTLVLWKKKCKFFLSEITINTAIIHILCPLRRAERDGSNVTLSAPHWLWGNTFLGSLMFHDYCPFLQYICFHLYAPIFTCEHTYTDIVSTNCPVCPHINLISGLCRNLQCPGPISLFISNKYSISTTPLSESIICK